MDVVNNPPHLQGDSSSGMLLSFPAQAYGPPPDQATGGAGYYPNVPVAVQPYAQDQRQRLGHSPLQNSYSLPAPSEYSPLPSAPPPPVQPPQSGYPSIGMPYPMYPPFGNYEHGQPLVYYGSRQHSPSYRPSVPLYPAQLNERQPQPQPPPFVLPPPPEAPEAVASYKAPDAPTDGRTTLEGAADVHDKRMRAVVFGSIGLPGSSKGPSPSPHPGGETADHAGAGEDEGKKVEKAFASFSIGVAPGEPGPSRVRPTKARKRAETRSMADASTAAGSMVEEEKEESPKVERRVIDLTETKWAFGTIKSPPTGYGELDACESLPAEPASSPDAPSHIPVPAPEPMLLVPSATASPPMGLQHPPLVLIDTLTIQPPMTHLASPINGLPMAAPFPVQRSTIPPLAVDTGTATGTEWEVKDFGYGFGHGAYAPQPQSAGMAREERLARERAERERERVEAEREREGMRERDFVGRPRRGSYGGYGGYDRGGFGGRRGRGGVNGGYSAGGARGYNGRGGRGGYQPQPQPQPRQPPFTVTPPPQFQPLSPHGDPSATFYAPRQPLATYIPTGYETYQPPPGPVPSAHANARPPVPVPLSTLSFPLDPVRTCLLGQLEYYLSPQNMAQDFFLRQRVHPSLSLSSMKQS
jgi:la-related protein 1